MASMEYRTLPRGNENISVIGLGLASIRESDVAEMQRTIERALEGGINFFDVVAANFRLFAAFGRAIRGSRERVFTQMHFGAVYETGPERAYGWTLDADRIARAVEENLDAIGTDYTDFGMVHCIDEERDFNRVMEGGTWDYLQRLKAAGTVRHIGVSTHDPHIARLFLETGLVDLIMFSINPAYDYAEGTFGIGSVAARSALYRDCERASVGISVMKAFGGGLLIDEKRSPFKRALTKNQLIQYALDRPGVMSVLPGARNAADVDDVLGFLDATDEERDYAEIGTFAPADAEGVCVYCNHCQPCPAGIDVGLVNKYYDLSRAGDALAHEHYLNLAVRADDCLQCGHCESRCPFKVHQEARMEEIAAYFA